MLSFLDFLLALALAATAVTLFIGIGELLSKKKGMKRALNSNKLMQLRIVFQAVTLIILGLLFLLSQKGN